MAGYRAWIFLSCNEFGWFKTTDRERSMFGQIISIGMKYRLCADLFGESVGAEYVERQVAATVRWIGLPEQYEVSVEMSGRVLGGWAFSGSLHGERARV